MSCNCNKVTENNTVEQISMALVIENNPNIWVDVIYQGANYTHFIPSPTGVIRQFGLKNYGLGKRGMKVKVHIKELPSSLFKEYIEETQEIVNSEISSNIDEKLNSILTELDIQMPLENNNENIVSTNEIIIEKPKRNTRNKKKNSS